MIEKILERFEAGEYNEANGAKLFLLDMKEVEEYIDNLQEEYRAYRELKEDY